MTIRKRAAASAVAAATAAAGFAAIAPVAHAATTRTGDLGLPVVVARMSGNAIHLNVGSSMHAGRVEFKVVSTDGRNHTLQLVWLRKGYTIQQLGQDLGKSFGGDVDAVNRVDENAVTTGGAESKKDKPAYFTTTLRDHKYYLLDQNGNGIRALTVTGTPPSRPAAPHVATVNAFTYGWETSKPALPAQGWIKFHNQADQPHFIVLQKIKDSTTSAMVRKFFKSGAQGNPSWGLKPNVNTGVLSPNQTETVKLNQPAGTYLLMCFWPDFKTGMPHAFMGMWKIVHLA